MSICTKCEKRIVMHSITTGVCEICKKEFYSGCTPANKLCPQCAELNKNICETCNTEIKEGDLKNEMNCLFVLSEDEDYKEDFEEDEDYEEDFGEVLGYEDISYENKLELTKISLEEAIKDVDIDTVYFTSSIERFKDKFFNYKLNLYNYFKKNVADISLETFIALSDFKNTIYLFEDYEHWFSYILTDPIFYAIDDEINVECKVAVYTNSIIDFTKIKVKEEDKGKSLVQLMYEKYKEDLKDKFYFFETDKNEIMMVKKYL